MQQVPTIVSFLEKLLPKSDHKFLTYLIIVILKHRCKHMSLFQRVMSVLLYANGTSKQVSKFPIDFIVLRLVTHIDI